jgi:hypothetical protein
MDKMNRIAVSLFSYRVSTVPTIAIGLWGRSLRRCGQKDRFTRSRLSGNEKPKHNTATITWMSDFMLAMATRPERNKIMAPIAKIHFISLPLLRTPPVKAWASADLFETSSEPSSVSIPRKTPGWRFAAPTRWGNPGLPLHY